MKSIDTCPITGVHSSFHRFHLFHTSVFVRCGSLSVPLRDSSQSLSQTPKHINEQREPELYLFIYLFFSEKRKEKKRK
jgi:hypothetical protein